MDLVITLNLYYSNLTFSVVVVAVVGGRGGRRGMVVLDREASHPPLG